MPRNKRTVVLAHEDLAPLTERILGRMGPEGAVIRSRLQHFFRERARPPSDPPESQGKTD
jgi:hypothetical protein